MNSLHSMRSILAVLVLASVMFAATAQSQTAPTEAAQRVFDAVNDRSERAQVAMAAVECGLRDGRWFTNFVAMMETTRTEVAERIAAGNRAQLVLIRNSLQSAEHAGSQAGIREVRDYRAQACPRIRNLPLLRQIDALIGQ